MRRGLGPLLADLNPLRVVAAPLPLAAALLAKMVVVALLVKRYDLLPPPGVSFLAVLDPLRTQADALAALRLVFGLGAVAVLFNIATRAGALLVSLALFVSTLWNIAAFAQSRLFAACLLLLVALTTSERGLSWIRWQVVLLYAGAALNKLTNADWWDGRFLDAYSLSKPHLFFYPEWQAVAGLWPALALSWASMALELAVALALTRQRWVPLGLLCGLVLHGGVMAWLGFDFDAFFYCVVASYAACARWPTRIVVRPPAAGAGALAVRGLARVEWSRLWVVEAADPQATLSLDLVDGATPERRRGAAAWRALVLHHPTLLVVALALLAVPSSYTPLGWARVVLVGLLVALLGVPAVADAMSAPAAGPEPSA